MATAQIRPDWTIGTLNLTAGVVDFTTTDSMLETAAIQAGDSIITESGLVLIIATITGQNAGTLMEPCPAGAAGIGQPLRVRFQPDGSRYNGATADLVQLLGSGNVYEFAGLDGTGGGVPVFTGPGTMDVVPSGEVGIQDPNGSLGKLAALTLAANKALATDASGDVAPIDLGTLGRALLALATGTNTQYVRADGTLQTLNASTVGLGNVNNTSDANKPVSTAQQAALDLKLDKSGNSGLASSYIWARQVTAGTIALHMGEVNNLGPSGGGYSRMFFHGNAGSLNVSSFFEIQHGNWHGLTFAIVNGPGQPTHFFNLRSNGGFYAPGSINGSAKNFEVDHTVDPDNYDLRHCATEAPEMLVEYRGIAKLTNGRVTVNVEDHYGVMTNTFKNLWADAHVHALQNQDGFARVRPSPVDGATFDIICEDETCSDNVAWLVMARRNDPYVRWEGCTFTDDDGHLIIEFEKPE